MLAGLIAGLSIPAHAYDSYDYDSYEYDETTDHFYPDHERLETADDFEAMAKVTRVETVYETIIVKRPVTECWTEQHRVPVAEPDHRVAGSVIGGILGGVVGHQAGRGRGRDVATVAGSLLGAAIGYNVGSRRVSYWGPAYHDRKVCETVDHSMAEERVSGYRVEYSYQGQTFVTHTDRHPGQWIRLQVNVSPT